MLVSIIVPSRNHARFLPATLNSILEQSHRPLEVIVIDGGSNDGTLEILQSYEQKHSELRWISEADNGPADAINKGLALARGGVIGIQNSDDLYCPDALRDVVRFFESHPDCGLVYGDVQGMGQDGQLLGRTRLPGFSWEAMFGIALCLPQGSIFFRTEQARAVGGWNPSYFSCDLDYWLRLMMRASATKLPEVLSLWRVHPDQRTQPKNFARILRDYRRMVDESPEIHASPRRIRRLAAASRDIMALKFDIQASRWRRQRYALMAFLRHPTFWRYLPRRTLLDLLPAYAAYQRLRRYLRQKSARQASG